MRGIAVGEHIGLSTGLRRGVQLAVRHDLLQRADGLGGTACPAVSQDFECGGVAVYASVFKQPGQHMFDLVEYYGQTQNRISFP